MNYKAPLTYILLAFCFIFIAFYNGYPLMTSDTGAYINNGYELFLPPDRSIFYSLFLRVTSLTFSLWIPVFVQGIILTFLSYRFIRLIIPEKTKLNHAFPIIAIATIFGTSVSWFGSQLMPDIFTPILAMTICLFIFDKPSKLSNILYLTIIVLANIFHNSHLVIFLLFSLILLAYCFWTKSAFLKKSILLCSFSIGSIFLIMLTHQIGGHGMVLSQSGHVFIMGKFSENGVLKKYLDRNCQDNQYELCQYRSDLPTTPWEFHWNPESPVFKMGGWEASKPEFKKVINEIILSPKYWTLLTFKSAEHTIRQLSQINIGDGIHVYKEGTNPYWKVQQYFEHELPEFLESKQNTQKLNFNFFNAIQTIYFIISSLLVLSLMYRRELTIREKHIYILIILFLVLNAFVTANLSSVLGRFNSRVFWLIPFLNTCILAKEFFTNKES